MPERATRRERAHRAHRASVRACAAERWRRARQRPGFSLDAVGGACARRRGIDDHRGDAPTISTRAAADHRGHWDDRGCDRDAHARRDDSRSSAARSSAARSPAAELSASPRSPSSCAHHGRHFDVAARAGRSRAGRRRCARVRGTFCRCKRRRERVRRGVLSQRSPVTGSACGDRMRNDQATIDALQWGSVQGSGWSLLARRCRSSAWCLPRAGQSCVDQRSLAHRGRFVLNRRTVRSSSLLALVALSGCVRLRDPNADAGDQQPR